MAEDMTTGEIRLHRRHFGFAAGRIMNEKLVVIQAVSVIIRGASSALPKDAVVDVRHGDFLEPRPGRTPRAAAGPRSAPGGCVVCVSPSPLRAEGWGAGHGPPSSVRRAGPHLQCAFRPASRNCSARACRMRLESPASPPHSPRHRPSPQRVFAARSDAPPVRARNPPCASAPTCCC